MDSVKKEWWHKYVQGDGQKISVSEQAHHHLQSRDAHNAATGHKVFNINSPNKKQNTYLNSRPSALKE